MNDESGEQHGLLTPGQRRYLRGEDAEYSNSMASQHRSGIQDRLEYLGEDLALIVSAYDADRVDATLSDHPIPVPAIKMLLEHADGVEAIHPLSEYIAAELRAIEHEAGGLAETIGQWDPREEDDA